jgi:hypothetical protein
VIISTHLTTMSLNSPNQQHRAGVKCRPKVQSKPSKAIPISRTKIGISYSNCPCIHPSRELNGLEGDICSVIRLCMEQSGDVLQLSGLPAMHMSSKPLKTEGTVGCASWMAKQPRLWHRIWIQPNNVNLAEQMKFICLWWTRSLDRRMP